MRKYHQNLWESFGSAFRGLRHAAKERNFALQLAIGAVAIMLAFVLDLSTSEEIAVLVVCALVLGAEMVNSSLERALDIIHKEHSEEVAHIKEILAGAVLLFAILSVVVGLLIFGPRIWK